MCLVIIAASTGKHADKKHTISVQAPTHCPIDIGAKQIEPADFGEIQARQFLNGIFLSLCYTLVFVYCF